MRKSLRQINVVSSARGFASVLALASALCGMSTASQARDGCDVVVFWDAGFKGESLTIRDDRPFVGPHWNDQISSIIVRAGTWDFYWDANYGGEVLRYGPGRYEFVGPHWNDQISSMRCLAGGAGDRGADVFVEGGQSYGWYDDGWNGPGFYIVGFEHRRGRGFGGRDGFHGRHHGAGRHGGEPGHHGGDHGGSGHHGGGHPGGGRSHHGGGGHPGGGGGHHGGGGGHPGGGGGHHGGGGGHPGGGGGHHGGGGGHPSGGGGHHGGGGHPGGGSHHGGGGHPPRHH